MSAERLLRGTVKPSQFAGRGGSDTASPLWVISGHFACCEPMSGLPPKADGSAKQMSALGQ